MPNAQIKTVSVHANLSLIKRTKQLVTMVTNVKTLIANGVIGLVMEGENYVSVYAFFV